MNGKFKVPLVLSFRMLMGFTILLFLENFVSLLESISGKFSYGEEGDGCSYALFDVDFVMAVLELIKGN